jgi:endonuclease/exonuclease/phosphatase family metal-dependent hydrolase
MALRIVSVNIERSKHLDLVEAFLDKQQPDVVCMQELIESDCARIATAFGASWHSFAPMSRLVAENPGVRYGLGLFSRVPVAESGVAYYVHKTDDLPETHPYDSATFNNEHRMVLWCDAQKDGETFRLATTHFTWTPRGNADDEQRRAAAALLAQLEGFGEFVLCGDFNAPRIYEGKPGEIFSLFAEKYADNIPLEYETSIDGSIHRAGPLPYMVDGVFSTPGYQVSDAALHTGVSDHCAITAMVARI